MRTGLLIFLAFCSTAWAGTVRLVNDSAVKLKAVIRAADGTELGTVDVNPQQTMSWNNYWGGVGNIQYNDVSQTPYTVVWFCNLSEENQTPYSVCQGVSSGATVTASSGDGTRACQQPKKKQKGAQPGSYGYQQQGPSPQQENQQQTEQDSGPPQGMID
jgi:hypothetical protein